MNTLEQTTQAESDLSLSSRARLLSLPGEPFLYADWERVMFIHYEVDLVSLQREVPFDLDLREGRAYISLVAFTMRGLRPRIGGNLGAGCAAVAHLRSNVQLRRSEIFIATDAKDEKPQRGDMLFCRPLYGASVP